MKQMLSELRDYAKYEVHRVESEVVVWNITRVILLNLINDNSPAVHSTETNACFGIRQKRKNYVFCTTIDTLNKAIPLQLLGTAADIITAVSYTHLTLPTTSRV